MKLPVRDVRGNELRTLDVDDSVFGIQPNAAVLHQAYVTQRNNQRWGTANTKTRGEVQGSTRKVRMQKYTGNARAGSNRSPTRKGGGVVFGPRQRDYSRALPRKMRRLAIRSALSGKVADGQLVVIDQFVFETPRTRELIRVLHNVGIERSALIVTAQTDRTVRASASNLQKTKVLPAAYLNVVDMMHHQGIVMTEDAVRIAEQLWAVRGPPKPEAEPATKRPRARAKAAAKAEIREEPAVEPKPRRAARERAAAPAGPEAPKAAATPVVAAKAPVAARPRRAAKAPAQEGAEPPKRRMRQTAPRASVADEEPMEKPKRVARTKAEKPAGEEARKPRRRAKQTEREEG